MPSRAPDPARHAPPISLSRYSHSVKLLPVRCSLSGVRKGLAGKEDRFKVLSVLKRVILKTPGRVTLSPQPSTTGLPTVSSVIVHLARVQFCACAAMGRARASRVATRAVRRLLGGGGGNGINLIFAAIHLSEAPGGGAPAGDQEGLGGFHLPMGFGETR